jgi:sporulation protein YlmC with PRC-barrel domain
MRYLMSLLVIGCVSLLLGAGSAHARDKSGVLKASQLMGMNVEGTDGKKLGDVKDLVIDPDDGSIDYVVLDFGGILGIGKKYFAIPWDALELTADKKKLVMDATKRDLKAAPGFDKNHWPDLNDPKEQVVIYEFYEIPVPTESSAGRSPQKKK